MIKTRKKINFKIVSESTSFELIEACVNLKKNFGMTKFHFWNTYHKYEAPQKEWNEITKKKTSKNVKSQIIFNHTRK